MFHSKTVFVIGAGASAEAGLPTGEGLKHEIAMHIDMKFDDLGRTQISGDSRIFAALDTKVGRYQVNNYLHSAWQLKNALPQAISIDNLLDAHKDDEKLILCGKLGIVRSILIAEKKSKLFFDPRSGHGTVDLTQMQSSWFIGFMRLLTERVAKSDLNHLFENVSMINFNYDRCVEQYMHTALQSYYAVDSVKAAEVISNLKILRPYGKVGRLEWQTLDPQPIVSFGAENTNLVNLSEGIKTFFETVHETENIGQIRNEIKNADTIVFLGFAFHPQNLDLLFGNQGSDCNYIFGTAFGISVSDRETIEEDLVERIRKPRNIIKINLRTDLKCSGLFVEYWRSLTKNRSV